MLITALAIIAVLVIGSVLYNAFNGSITPGSSAYAESEKTDGRKAAPDIVFLDVDGNEVKISDFAGKPVILNFWTSWCVYCKKEMPDFEAAYDKYGDKIDFVMLNIAYSEYAEDDGRKYYAESGYTFPFYYDKTDGGTKTYNLRGYPMSVFIDAQGNIVSYHFGALSAELLERNIAALLTE